jgi:hypothetical protein
MIDGALLSTLVFGVAAAGVAYLVVRNNPRIEPVILTFLVGFGAGLWLVMAVRLAFGFAGIHVPNFDVLPIAAFWSSGLGSALGALIALWRELNPRLSWVRAPGQPVDQPVEQSQKLENFMEPGASEFDEQDFLVTMLRRGRDESWRPDKPDARVDWIDGEAIITIRAYVAGGNELATVEVRHEDCLKLPPVRHAVAAWMRRKKQPTYLDPGPRTLSAPAIPDGWIERRHGEDWVVLTAYRRGSRQTATVEMRWDQWMDFPLVVWAHTLEEMRRNPHLVQKVDFTHHPEWQRTHLH